MHGWVRDGEGGVVANKRTITRQYNIEVEHPGIPALPAAAAAEGGFDSLTDRQHFAWAGLTLHQRAGIGIEPRGGAERCTRDDRRERHRSAAFLRQRISGRHHHRSRRTMPVRADVGAQRDQVAMCQRSSHSRPYSSGRRSRKKPMPARCLAARSRSSVATSTPSSCPSFSGPNSTSLSPHSLVMKLCP